MPCPDKKAARVYLSPDDYTIIEKAAKMAGLSISYYMREVCLGGQVKSFEHEEFKLELIKTRADLGRLGGLFKAALADPEKIFERAESDAFRIKTDFRSLLREIEKRQEELRRLVAKI
jgi:hypothetical protein